VNQIDAVSVCQSAVVCALSKTPDVSFTDARNRRTQIAEVDAPAGSNKLRFKPAVEDTDATCAPPKLLPINALPETVINVVDQRHRLAQVTVDGSFTLKYYGEDNVIVDNTLQPTALVHEAHVRLVGNQTRLERFCRSAVESAVFKSQAWQQITSISVY
jgi:hypothetical protein